MSSSKKFTCKGTLRQVFNCWDLFPHNLTPSPPPSTHCLYLRVMNKLGWVSSALSFIGGVHIGARVLLDINWYSLAISLAYRSEEEGGILLVQMISTRLRCAYRKGGGGQLVSIYCTLTQRRGGGGVEPERRLEGLEFKKLGRKYQHDWLYLQSINSDKNLPQSYFTGQFFRWRHFALVSI